jgi:hypothetical protein
VDTREGRHSLERRVGETLNISASEGTDMRVLLTRGVAAAIAVAIIVFYLDLLFGLLGGRFLKAPTPYVGGALALVLIYSLYAVLAGDLAIWNAAKGDDGRASTSKFQVLLWFGVVVFSYVAVVTSRFQAGETDPLAGIPANVLIALGISVVTVTGAAAVTASQVNAGREVKTSTDNKGLAPLVQTDAGQADLGKIQLLGWTVIAIAVFLATLAREMPAPDSLPDIDPALLVLTGVGSATYLGGKLVSTATPFVSSISVGSAAVDVPVTVIGANFGTTGRVEVGGVELQTGVASWSDKQITFSVPPTKPDNSAWPTGTPLTVRVLTSSGPSANAVQLTLQ